MGLKRAYLAGFGTALLLVSCAATFPYRYYPYDAAHQVLLGAEPKDDLPLSVCNSVPGTAYPCIMVKSADFFNLKADFLKTKQDLIDCQKGAPPSAK